MNNEHKKLILISLNEINFDIAYKYAKKYNLKNFQYLIENKTINYITESEKDYNKLEPWIQWSSVYTGLSSDDHGIFRLGDILSNANDQIFEKIENLNLKVGAISPMNVENRLKFPAYFIPDPWTQTNHDGSFWSKLITNVLIKSVNQNAKNKLNYTSIFFLFFIFLRFARIKNYINFIYLFLFSKRKKWRKAIFLDLLINDIHIKFINKYSPNFSNVFFNAGAHIQHHHFLKSIFAIKNNNFMNKNIDFIDPIYESLFYYDKILSDYVNNKSYNFIIFTGLTQTPNPYPTYYYRLKDHKNFLSILRIKYKAIYPRMSRDFLIEFKNLSQSQEALRILSNLKTSNGEKIFEELDDRGLSIFVTLTYNKIINKNMYINFNNLKFNFLNLVDFVAIKNGIHNEKGYLFASKNLKNLIGKKKLNVKDIHKIILNFFKN